jgi:hypothetical protein
MKKRILKVSFVLLVFLGLFLLLSSHEPGGDWTIVLQPSTRAFLSGQNPYDEPAFLTPFWGFVLLIPAAILPPALGSALFATIGAAGYLLAD